jgi:hypothetical protein
MELRQGFATAAELCRLACPWQVISGFWIGEKTMLLSRLTVAAFVINETRLANKRNKKA